MLKQRRAWKPSPFSLWGWSLQSASRTFERWNEAKTQLRPLGCGVLWFCAFACLRRLSMNANVEGSLESTPIFPVFYVALLSFVDINFWSLKLGLASWSFLCGPYFANNWLHRNRPGFCDEINFSWGDLGQDPRHFLILFFYPSIHPPTYLSIHLFIYLVFFCVMFPFLAFRPLLHTSSNCNSLSCSHVQFSCA